MSKVWVLLISATIWMDFWDVKFIYLSLIFTKANGNETDVYH